MLKSVTVYTHIMADSQNKIVEEANSVKDLLDALHTQTKISSELISDSKAALDPGTIVTEIIETGGLASFLSVIIAWLAKDRSRSIKLQIGENSIEASKLTQDEQQRLITWFQKQTGIKLTSR